MVCVQEINYSSTTIHHRHNTCTIFGIRPHTNTRAQLNTKYEYKLKYKTKYKSTRRSETPKTWRGNSPKSSEKPRSPEVSKHAHATNIYI